MAFNGTWQVYVQEKYDEFLKGIGKHGLRSKVQSGGLRGAASPVLWDSTENWKCRFNPLGGFQSS